MTKVAYRAPAPSHQVSHIQPNGSPTTATSLHTATAPLHTSPLFLCHSMAAAHPANDHPTTKSPNFWAQPSSPPAAHRLARPARHPHRTSRTPRTPRSSTHTTPLAPLGPITPTALPSSAAATTPSPPTSPVLPHPG